MRIFRRLLVCGIAIAAAHLTAAPAASAAADEVRGTWTSTDTDGSQQVLTVRGGARARPAVTLEDEAASVCGGAPARMSGPATLDGTTLTMHGALTCRPGGNPFPGQITITWHYDHDTDTLTDQFGVTWHRAA